MVNNNQKKSNKKVKPTSSPLPAQLSEMKKLKDEVKLLRAAVFTASKAKTLSPPISVTKSFDLRDAKESFSCNLMMMDEVQAHIKDRQDVVAPVLRVSWIRVEWLVSDLALSEFGVGPVTESRSASPAKPGVVNFRNLVCHPGRGCVLDVKNPKGMLNVLIRCRWEES